MRSSKKALSASSVGGAMGPAAARSRVTNFDLARLVLEGVDETGERARRFGRSADGAGDLLAKRELALGVDVSGLGIAVGAQHLVEQIAVELAARPAEGRIVVDAADQLLIGDAEAKLPGPLVQGGLGEHLGQHLPVEAERPRLIRGDRPAGLAAERLKPLIVDLTETLGRNVGRADRGDVALAEAAEDVADAPDGERHHQKAEENLGDPARRAFSQGLEH